jgi:hypothetical protein
MDMIWARVVGGIVLVVLGLLWMAQGLNLLPGSIMSGQAMWVVIGLLVLLVGAWLLWDTSRGRSRSATQRD